MTASDLELMVDGAHEQVVGVFFPNVMVPPRATVLSASVLFEVDELRYGSSNADVTIAVHGEQRAQRPLASVAHDLSARVRTHSRSLWRPAPSAVVGEVLETGDLSPVIQEIIAQPGPWPP